MMKYKLLSVIAFLNKSVSSNEIFLPKRELEHTDDDDPCLHALDDADIQLGAQLLKYSISYPKMEIGEGYKTFFQEYVDSCPITSCTLREYGCLKPYTTNDYLTLQEESPWQLTARQDINYGYKDFACLQCTNGKQTIVKDNLIIEQSTMCLASLTPKQKTVGHLQLKYNIRKTVVEVGDGLTSFFDNMETDKCALTDCFLRQEGCGPRYTGDKIDMTSARPWTITARINVKKGYDETVCVECTNNNQIIQHKGLRITQFTNCISAMTHVFEKDKKWEQNLSYNSRSEWSVPALTYFKSSDLELCPFTSCKLMDRRCRREYTGDNLSIENDKNPYKISARRDVKLGYVETICIQCKNKEQIINQDNYVVRLGTVCQSSLSTNTQTNSVTTLYDDDSNNSYQNTGFGLDNFFSNSFPTACPIQQSTCAILEQGCQADYTGKNIKYDESLSQYVQFTNEEDGYTEKVCVKCSNGQQTVTKDNIQVIQRPMCYQIIGVKQNYPKSQTMNIGEESKNFGDGPSSFFDNKYPEKCAFDNCKLKDNNCRNELSNDFIKLTEKDNQIQQLDSGYKGLKSTFCYECTAKGDVISVNGLSMSQTSSCSTSLSTKTLDSPSKYSYLYGEKFTDVIDGNQFFQSSIEQCNLRTCSLMQKDCKNKYRGSDVKVYENTKIVAKTNTFRGYDEELCLQCSNGYQSIESQGLRFTQKGQCDTAMKIQNNTKTDYVFDYSTKNYQNIGNHQTFFNVPSVCSGIDECVIKEQGCKNEYTGDKLKLIKSNTQVQAVTNYDQEYEENFCLQCSNSKQTKEYDNIKVRQKSMCESSLSQSSNNRNFNFNYQQEKRAVGSKTSDFIRNAYPKQCPITKCELSTLDCGNGNLDDSNLKKITMDEKTFEIFAESNVPRGYKQQFCYKCYNDKDSAQVKLSVSQSDKCINTLNLVYYDKNDLISSINVQSKEMKTVEFFGNSNKEDCPIQQCQLFNSDCKTEYEGGDNAPVGLDTTKTRLDCLRDIPEGYKLNLCMQCSNVAQTIKRDNIFVQQYSKCYNTMLMKDVNNLDPISIEYQNKQERKELGKAFDDYFHNNDDKVCPIKTCKLLNKGCKSSLANNGNVQMENVSPWTVSYAQNTNFGYDEKFCIKCNNGFADIQQDGLAIAQSSKYINTLKLRPDPMKSSIIDLDRDSKPLVISQGWSDFFINEEEAENPVKQCQIMNEDCQSKYSGSNNLKIESQSPFRIVPNAIVNGKVDKVCMKCSNGYDVKTSKFTVDIISKCLSSLQINSGQNSLVTMDYSKDKSYQSAASLPNSLFANSQPQDCPITECQMFPKGCKNNRLQNSRVSLKYVNGLYYFEAQQGIIPGYEEEICLMCKNKFQTAYRDNFKFVQKNKCYDPRILTNLGRDQKQMEYKIPFNQTVAPEFIGYGWQSYFDNKDHSNCPINNCWIMNNDCYSPYVQTNLRMTGCMPFQIDSNQNVTRGYNEKVCVKCTNGFDTVTQSDVNVEQSAKYLKDIGSLVESQMDFQVLHTEAISSIWTKTTHITLWVIFVILIAMILAICVGYKMYKDKPAEVKTVEVIKYINTEPQTTNMDAQPQSMQTIVKGKLIRSDRNAQQNMVNEAEQRNPIRLDEIDGDDDDHNFQTGRKLINHKERSENPEEGEEGQESEQEEHVTPYENKEKISVKFQESYREDNNFEIRIQPSSRLGVPTSKEVVVNKEESIDTVRNNF